MPDSPATLRRPPRSRSSAVAALATALLLAFGTAEAPAGARAPQAESPLARPDPAPLATAEGTVRLRYTPRGQSVRFRFDGLEPRTSYAVRIPLAEPVTIARTRTRRTGRAEIRLRDSRLPPEVPSLLANRPVEVVPVTDSVAGPAVLTGRIPIVEPYPYWTDPSDPGSGGGGNGGGGGGGPPPTTTRLAGVDGNGPLAVTSATFSLPTAPGGLAPGSTVVWYPGSGATVASGGPWPPVVLVHAFQLGSGDYQEWGRKIASWGFVVAVPGHADPLFVPDNEKEVKTTLGVMNWLVAENANASSRFSGALDVRKFGFVGHSLGGGAAIVASTRTEASGRVKAAVGLAPAALTTQSGLLGGSTPILPDTTTGAWPPTLVVTGSEDKIVAPSLSRSTYFSPAPAPRAFVRLDRHCHLNYADNLPALVAFGSDYDAATCTTQAGQLAEARTYVVSWLLFHLRGDTRVRDYVDGTFAAEQAIVEERAFE